ncbi:MAG: GntR family transcriptional regulator [Pseudomonadales bacterium]|nr:GntR family transcriptional regulator [Pseudomonadales bacterium]MCJ8339376.1 GntR family transcriptional regulator [Pseudomonadales bacterium]NRA16920.1 GntR family transcriptional regulator [Oceanospirillaceae bacterium]
MSKSNVVTPKRTRGDGANRIFNILREEILSMQLSPGQPVDEVGLAERFGVSRSPVREALVRLAAQGLVSTLPNKSTIISPLNIEEFPQYIDALDLLQRATHRLAAILRTDEDLASIDLCQQQFAQAVKDGDVVAMIERNQAFHMAIASASRNGYLSKSYSSLLDEGRRILRLYFRSYNDTLPPELVVEHDHIIAAIRSQDADLAERLAHEHSIEVKTRFLEYMATSYTSGIKVS